MNVAINYSYFEYITSHKIVIDRKEISKIFRSN